MTGGSITLNGLTDAAIALIFEHRSKVPHSFTFLPQTMTPATIGNKQVYNNVTFTWSSSIGFKSVMTLVQAIASKHGELQPGT